MPVDPTFDLLRNIIDETYPIEMPDLERAKTIVLVSARDSLHIAIMERRGVSRILSFDSGFDHFQNLKRLH